MDTPIRIYASDYASGTAEDTNAVLVAYGQLVARMSIGQARDISNRLAVAADEAELKLKG
jgi:hypothetical protein